MTERGLINHREQDLIHKELVIKLLESLMLPEEIAIVHVPGYQQGNSLEAQGNNLADKAVKAAVLHPKLQMLYLTPLSRHPTPFSLPWRGSN
jgi:hypothetical protein